MTNYWDAYMRELERTGVVQTGYWGDSDTYEYLTITTRLPRYCTKPHRLRMRRKTKQKCF